jgi:hypothetical protein
MLGESQECDHASISRICAPFWPWRNLRRRGDLALSQFTWKESSMPSDIKLNDGSDGNWVTAEASVLNIKGHDLILDSASRRGAHSGGFRRALVHDQSDGLTINFNNDYTGGVTINGLNVRLRVLDQTGAPKLPKDGNAGDLVAINRAAAGAIGVTMTLWLCGGQGTTLSAKWHEVPLGQSIIGTL